MADVAQRKSNTLHLAGNDKLIHAMQSNAHLALGSLAGGRECVQVIEQRRVRLQVANAVDVEAGEA